MGTDKLMLGCNHLTRIPSRASRSTPFLLTDRDFSSFKKLMYFLFIYRIELRVKKAGGHRSREPSFGEVQKL